MRTFSTKFSALILVSFSLALVLVTFGTGQATSAALRAIPPNERVLYARHRVERGDTLSHISARHNVPVSVLKTANELDGDFLCSHAKVVTRDIHGHIGAGLQALEQDACLGTTATAGFDQQMSGAGLARDFIRIRNQHRRLGAGGVVLGQLGDGIEQPRSLGIVEVLRRDRFLCPRKSRQHIRRQVVARGMQVVETGRFPVHAAFALLPASGG